MPPRLVTQLFMLENTVLVTLITVIEQFLVVAIIVAVIAVVSSVYISIVSHNDPIIIVTITLLRMIMIA